MNEPTSNSFFLWASFANAGTFLEGIDEMPPEDLSSNDNLKTCDAALGRLMEIKTRILNAKETINQTA
jgi:hypothetical protein